MNPPEHIHVALPSGATARVALDASPETLQALDAMARAAKDGPGAFRVTTGSVSTEKYARLVRMSDNAQLLLSGFVGDERKRREKALNEIMCGLAAETKARDEVIAELKTRFVEQVMEALDEDRNRWRAALVFIAEHGGHNHETECGTIACNGSWCAEQARASLQNVEIRDARRITPDVER